MSGGHPVSRLPADPLVPLVADLRRLVLGATAIRPDPRGQRFEDLGDRYANRFHVSKRTLQRDLAEVRSGIVTLYAADRLCLFAGYHPGEIYGDAW